MYRLKKSFRVILMYSDWDATTFVRMSFPSILVETWMKIERDWTGKSRREG